jgi:hypothetical protein
MSVFGSGVKNSFCPVRRACSACIARELKNPSSNLMLELDRSSSSSAFDSDISESKGDFQGFIVGAWLLAILQISKTSFVLIIFRSKLLNEEDDPLLIRCSRVSKII